MRQWVASSIDKILFFHFQITNSRVNNNKKITLSYYFELTISPQDVSRTSPSNVPRIFPRDSIWTFPGNPTLTSQGHPNLTYLGCPSMTSQERPESTSLGGPLENALRKFFTGLSEYVLGTLWARPLDVHFVLRSLLNLFDWPNLSKCNTKFRGVFKTKLNFYDPPFWEII